MTICLDAIGNTGDVESSLIANDAHCGCYMCLLVLEGVYLTSQSSYLMGQIQVEGFLFRGMTLLADLLALPVMKPCKSN